MSMYTTIKQSIFESSDTNIKIAVAGNVDITNLQLFTKSLALDKDLKGREIEIEIFSSKLKDELSSLSEQGECYISVKIKPDLNLITTTDWHSFFGDTYNLILLYDMKELYYGDNFQKSLDKTTDNFFRRKDLNISIENLKSLRTILYAHMGYFMRNNAPDNDFCSKIYIMAEKYNKNIILYLKKELL